MRQQSKKIVKTPSSHGSKYLISSNTVVGIDLIQWLFEAQNYYIIKRVLGQKAIEFEGSLTRMLPLDYYSLGYCISHSECQWVLQMQKEIGEAEVKMLLAGACSRGRPSNRVVGLKGKCMEQSLQRYMWREARSVSWQELRRKSMSKQRREKYAIALSDLDMLLTGLKGIVVLHQLSLSLELHDQCNHITSQYLSALRVLELVVSGQSERNLNSLLPNLSLESLTIAPASEGGCLVYNDCAAIGVCVTSALKELNISSDISDEKGVEGITAALASKNSLPLERLVLKCGCTFTAIAGDNLAQFITSTTRLQYLSVTQCRFSAHALLVLARAIYRNSLLHTKQLQDIDLLVDGDYGAKNLAKLLVEYPQLVKKKQILSAIMILEMAEQKP